MYNMGVITFIREKIWNFRHLREWNYYTGGRKKSRTYARMLPVADRANVANARVKIDGTSDSDWHARLLLTG